MPSALTDSPIWWLARQVFGKNRLSYYEEEDGFYARVRSPGWDRCFDTLEDSVATGILSGCVDEENAHAERMEDADASEEQFTPTFTALPEPEKTIGGRGGEKVLIVGWYSEADPANPINWPGWKKAIVIFNINFTAFVVYMASAIYTPSQPGVQEAFGVSSTASTLGMGLFIVGYGSGSLFWSPVSEIPAVGRNAPYILTLAVFLILSVPTALSDSFGMLLGLRFLQGFFGSPILSTGGASLSDIADSYAKPYSLYTWAVAALAGPSVGTIISGFTVPELGWRWSLWEILIIVSPALVLMLFLPETSTPTILYRRARMIRKATGSDLYVARSEIEAKNITLMDRFYGSLVIPWKINLLDPSIMFTSVYCGLIYAIFLSMFEFFPMVYGDIYGMTSGQIGLVLCCNIVAVTVAGIPYLAFVYYKVNPSIRKGKEMSPERRLLPALLAAVLIPVGIFLFGWTSRRSIHWMVPTVGAALTTAGFAIVLQTIFVYITLAYPQYAASLFAGNGFIKGIVAFGGILWSHPLYSQLGLAKGMSLLGALCAVCVSGIFVLYAWGEELRKRSRFAT